MTSWGGRERGAGGQMGVGCPGGGDGVPDRGCGTRLIWGSRQEMMGTRQGMMG